MRIDGRWAAAAVAVPFLIGATQPSTLVREDEETITHFADPEIIESSGLAVIDGRYVTVNDSGDAGRVFTVSPATGETVGVTTWEPDPVDVEALAPVIENGEATGEVWVGDIGDNLAARASVSLLRVEVGEGERSVTPASYELVYPDGPRDAESLVTDPATGRLYVVSKGYTGGAFYAVPENLDPDGPNRLERLGDAVAVATDAAFFPDGRHLVVRTYVTAHVYTFPGLEELDSIWLPRQPQGEGVAVDPADPDAILLTSEGVEQPILRVAVPDDLLAQMSSTTQTPSPGADDTAAGADGADGTAGQEYDLGLPPPWVAVAVLGGAVLLVGGLTYAVVRRRAPRKAEGV